MIKQWKQKFAEVRTQLPETTRALQQKIADVRTQLPETTRALQQKIADASWVSQYAADARCTSPEPLFRSPFTPTHPRVTATPPPPMALPGAPEPAAFVFGPRRASSMSTCAHHPAGNLQDLFHATHRGSFDTAVKLITDDPHVLYCKAGKQSALDDAIENDSPLAAVILAKTLARAPEEGKARLQHILRHAIAAAQRSQNKQPARAWEDGFRGCNMLASLLQALWLSEGDAWVEERIPTATSTTPVNDAWAAMHEAALEVLAPDDLEREDVNDLICHGAADLVMMGLSQRMAALDPALLIPTNLFNRDERVVVALAERVDTLKGYVRSKKKPDGAELADKDPMMVEIGALVGEANVILGNMNDRGNDATTRVSIGDSLRFLREALDRP